MSWNNIQQQQPGHPILFEDENIFWSLDQVSFEYEAGGGYPGQGVQLSCKSGKLILTNYRVIYLPDKQTVSLQSFSIPLQNLQDGKFASGWVTGYTYSGAVKSVPNEGLSNEYGILKIGLGDGGQDFQSRFDHLRSNLGAIPQLRVEALPLYQPLTESTITPLYEAPASEPMPPPMYK